MIDIRHTGDAGQINLGGPGASDAIDAHGDVIKVAAWATTARSLSATGMLSADTTLKLYSPGSNGNGQLRRRRHIRWSEHKIIAGNTVNIFNGVGSHGGATIPGASLLIMPTTAALAGWLAHRYFGGAGANNPLPLSYAPASTLLAVN